MGETLGEAYQIADDLLDALSSEAEAGKPTGQDAALSRPSAVAELGVAGAVEMLEALAAEAAAAVPRCPGLAEFALRHPLRGAAAGAEIALPPRCLMAASAPA